LPDAVQLKDAPELKPDMHDAGVVRAQIDLERIQLLINQGALPRIRLQKAQEDLENAEDLSILKQSLYSKDLMPEQADQMVSVAERMVLRKQRSLIQMQEMVSSGVISRSEAESSGADFDRAQTELHLAQTQARLIQQRAEMLRIEKGIASLELQVETHPDWAGKVYTKYDGNGVFTPSDLQKVSLAFLSRFAKALPISAEGETALHRSLGFDHRGRVDVAVNPDQPEGLWLMHFLEANRIPYFAFRMAVPGKATGAHIHIGPQSTRLALTD
jgi:multidrug resistance efflux pump